MARAGLLNSFRGVFRWDIKRRPRTAQNEMFSPQDGVYAWTPWPLRSTLPLTKEDGGTLRRPTCSWFAWTFASPIGLAGTFRRSRSSSPAIHFTARGYAVHKEDGSVRSRPMLSECRRCLCGLLLSCSGQSASSHVLPREARELPLMYGRQGPSRRSCGGVLGPHRARGYRPHRPRCGGQIR